MAADLPCPNPACIYVFPGDVVRGARMVSCPRCGTKFQFGAVAVPSGISPPEPIQHLTAQPMVAAVAENPVATADAGALSLSGDALSRRTQRRGQWRVRTRRVVAALVFTAGLAGGVAGVWWLVQQLPSHS